MNMALCVQWQEDGGLRTQWTALCTQAGGERGGAAFGEKG
jgi:hypothetical protein